MPKPTRTEQATDSCEVIPVGSRTASYRCGHEGPAKFMFSFWGEQACPSNELLAQREKCAKCLLAEDLTQIIRCAHCGFPIMPGDVVALYCDSNKWRECKVLINGSVVVCTRMYCARLSDFSGHWTGNDVQFLDDERRAEDGIILEV